MTDEDDALGLIPSAAVIVTFVLGAGAGFVYGGPVVAFVGAMGGALLACTVVFVTRTKSARGSIDRLPPAEVGNLKPEQALGMMSAMAQGAGGQPIKSEVLSKVSAIADAASDDPDAAARDARALREQYPRSAAVHAELARRELAVGRARDAAKAASQALRLALDGGMNPLAAKLVGELHPIREHIELSPQQFERLSRVLAAQGDQVGSAWAEAQRRDSADA